MAVKLSDRMRRTGTACCQPGPKARATSGAATRDRPTPAGRVSSAADPIRRRKVSAGVGVLLPAGGEAGEGGASQRLDQFGRGQGGDFGADGVEADGRGVHQPAQQQAVAAVADQDREAQQPGPERVAGQAAPGSQRQGGTIGVHDVAHDHAQGAVDAHAEQHRDVGVQHEPLR